MQKQFKQKTVLIMLNQIVQNINKFLLSTKKLDNKYKKTLEAINLEHQILDMLFDKKNVYPQLTLFFLILGEFNCVIGEFLLKKVLKDPLLYVANIQISSLNFMENKLSALVGHIQHELKDLLSTPLSQRFKIMSKLKPLINLISKLTTLLRP